MTPTHSTAVLQVRSLSHRFPGARQERAQVAAGRSRADDDDLHVLLPIAAAT